MSLLTFNLHSPSLASGKMPISQTAAISINSPTPSPTASLASSVDSTDSNIPLLPQPKPPPKTPTQVKESHTCGYGGCLYSLDQWTGLDCGVDWTGVTFYFFFNSRLCCVENHLIITNVLISSSGLLSGILTGSLWGQSLSAY